MKTYVITGGLGRYVGKDEGGKFYTSDIDEAWKFPSYLAACMNCLANEKVKEVTDEFHAATT